MTVTAPTTAERIRSACARAGGAMLAVGENARDTAERETPARAATSDAVTHGFLSLSFIDS